jgi:hypothetical protein
MSELKYRFFGLMGTDWFRYDPNKDANNKGTIERVSESIWGYWDSELEPIVGDIVAVVVAPQTCNIEILEAIENSLAIKPNGLNLYDSEYIRRLVAQYIRRIVAIKGTKKSFKVLFNMIGFECEIVEDLTNYSFDSPITFDDPDRRFDMGGCNSCTKFEVQILSRENAPGTPLTDAQQAAANSIIEFCTPIDTKITQLTIL